MRLFLPVHEVLEVKAPTYELVATMKIIRGSLIELQIILIAGQF
jgi:hypothetical protein